MGLKTTPRIGVQVSIKCVFFCQKCKNVFHFFYSCVLTLDCFSRCSKVIIRDFYFVIYILNVSLSLVSNVSGCSPIGCSTNINLFGRTCFRVCCYIPYIARMYVTFNIMQLVCLYALSIYFLDGMLLCLCQCHRSSKWG